MKKIMFNSGKGLLSKLCLTLFLMIGMGNTAWADTVIFDGNSIAAGWTNGGTTGDFVASTGSVTSKNNAFLTTTSGQLSPANGYTWYSLTSDNTVPMTASRTIEIGVKSLNSYGGELIVRYSTDGTTFTNAADITTELRNNDATADFNTLTIDIIPEGDQFIQIIGKAVYINSIVITGEGAALTTPKLSVTPLSIDFGTVRANDMKAITVSNTGVGSMDVTIANDNNTDFTISETTLTGIGAGESKTFNVTFNYDAANLGNKTANISVTPSYDAADAKTIAVTATAANANVWEDFSNGIPSTWYNENDYWLLTNGAANPGWGTTYALRTPRLYAEKNEEIGFDVILGGATSSYWIQAEYSTDCTNWTLIEKYAGNNSTSGVKTFVAPETGYYWLRFYGSQSGVDNFYGWTIAENTHDVVISASTIPATGTVYGTYTATATLTERGGSAENLTAELYFGNEKVAENEFSIGGNRNFTVSLSFTAEEEWEGLALIKISGENISTLETDPVEVSITETPYVLDENGNETFTCSSQVVKVNYTVQKGWNTIVMPFSLSGKPEYMSNIFGNDWVAYAISSYDNGALTFNKTTYLAVSVPYLIYAPNAETHENGVYLQAVSILNYAWTYSNLNQTKGDATFKGTFAPIAAPGMEGKYGLTPDGHIMNGNANASIKAYRAYFEFATTPAKISIVIDENDAPTLIGAVQMMENNAAVYDMMGRRVETLNGKVVNGQLPKGIYIVNGRKVVVK